MEEKIKLLRQWRDWHWSIYVQKPFSKQNSIILPDYDRERADAFAAALDVLEGKWVKPPYDNIKYKYGEWPE